MLHNLQFKNGERIFDNNNNHFVRIFRIGAASTIGDIEDGKIKKYWGEPFDSIHSAVLDHYHIHKPIIDDQKSLVV